MPKKVIAVLATLDTKGQEAEFLREHRVDPELAILRNCFDDSLESLPAKAFRRKYLANLLLFAFREFADVLFLLPAGFFHFLTLAAGAQVIADRHAQAIGKQISYSKDDHDDAGKSGSQCSRHDCEGGNAAVDATQDSIPQIAGTARLPKPRFDRVR